MKYIVITTINEPTEAVKMFSEIDGFELIVVGDRKTPEISRMTGNFRFFRFIPVDERFGAYSHECRENHYARKNIGYLYAMRQGAEIIAESDDDNIPCEGWGENVDFYKKLDVYYGPTFFNIYRLFDNRLWPRGFPLQEIMKQPGYAYTKQRVHVGVWQYLVDLNPDVDAIFRMTVPNERWNFSDSEAVLDKHVYCPFNSQNTFWTKEAFPLMYLPQTVSLRFCDILRGYIAQRLMWEKDLYLGFGPATVCQKRNKHDLFEDFKDEIDVYLRVKEVVDILESLELHGSFLEMLGQVYHELLMQNIVKVAEIKALNAWNEDINEILNVG